MSDKPKRLWFRFHLLTLVLIALAAGAAIGANLEVNNEAHLEQIEKDARAGNTFTFYGNLGNPVTFAQLASCREYGWPVTAYFAGNEYGMKPVYLAVGLAIDACAILLIIGGVGIVSETLIRRREGRKP